MIEWKKYEPFNDQITQPTKNEKYLIYSSFGVETAYFSTWGTWKISKDDVFGVTHYAQINLPQDIESTESPSEAASAEWNRFTKIISDGLSKKE